MRDVNQLDFYFNSGYIINLTPLHKPSEHFTGKEPFSEWTTKEYSDDAIKSAFSRGMNVGFVLDDDNLVVDCDPRNYPEGVNSLDELEKFLGFKLADKCPAVKTGSGGYHFYMSKPYDINIKETLEQFEGIEFKTKGRQVVCAGSATRFGEYRFINNITEYCECPQSLLELLKVNKSQSSGSDQSKISNETLRLLLKQLPADKFDSNDQWQPLMMACHYATDGNGIEEFVAWSLQDPKYAHAENQIRHRWDSLRDSKDNNITIGTLYKIVQSHGGTLNVVCDEFTDYADDSDDMGLIDDDDMGLTDESADNYPPLSQKKPFVDPAIAKGMIENINSDSDTESVQKCIRAIYANDDFIKQQTMLEELRKRLKCSKPLFSKLLTMSKDTMDSKKDLSHLLALDVLNHAFNYEKSKQLYNISQQFWQFKKTHWKTVDDDLINKEILLELEKFKQKLDPDTRFSELNLISGAFKFVKTHAAEDADVLNITGEPLPIINCKNGEIHITEQDNGRLSYKFIEGHRPESHQVSVNNIEYDPTAQCPQYDKALHEVFRNASQNDVEDMVRNFYEVIGYIMYVRKSPAHFFLFRGNGGDGKSTQMNIISALLGRDAVLPEHIERFKQGAGSDSHATTSLVGKLLVYDDDVNKNTILPDGVLKKLAENGEMTANPKGKSTFTFNKICTVVLCCNGFPKTKDLSRGFLRRAVVIPFDRSFSNDEMDKTLARRIIKTELPGIFNKALEGLERLHARGGNFLEPKSCMVAKQRWLNSANSIYEFVTDCLEITGDTKDRIDLPELYTSYIDYCSNGNIHKLTKSDFADMIESLNIKYTKQKTHSKVYLGIKFAEKPVEDFISDEDIFK